MRKILISIILLTTFISCDKTDPGNLKNADTILGGCFLEKGLSVKNNPISQADTVSYSFSNDSLKVFVGFNATCCSEYSSSSSIEGDSILIKIMTTQAGLCNCICYYTYNFRFFGNADSYKYHISGSSFDFKGQIKH